jgi:hypothetical protein
MNRRAFDLYAWLVPPILAPLSFWLWWHTTRGDLWLTLFAWLVPVVYAYVVPAVGTNLLKVWEFNTRFRLGRFRPHHGFVFGSATAALAWLVYPGPAKDLADIAVTALLFGTVIGGVNIVYDIYAVRAGYLLVYNQPWAEGRTPTAIVMDYAPWFFGLFGVVYGAGLGIADYLAGNAVMEFSVFAWLFPVMLGAAALFPVLIYRWQSFRHHGHSGCRPVARIAS